MDLSLRAYRVWQRNWDAFVHHWATEAGGVIIEPLVMLAAIGYGLGTYVQSFDGVSYAEFVAPGIMAGYAMFHATFECTYGAYMRMETHRIYDGIIVTPLSVEDVTLGEILWGATRSVLTAAAVLVVATGFGLVSSPMAILRPAGSFSSGHYVFLYNHVLHGCSSIHQHPKQLLYPCCHAHVLLQWCLLPLGSASPGGATHRLGAAFDLRCSPHARLGAGAANPYYGDVFRYHGSDNSRIPLHLSSAYEETSYQVTTVFQMSVIPLAGC